MQRARDIMTTQVVTVPPETPVAALAHLFADRGISGAPVVDGAGRLVGLVTEGDLIRKLASGQDRPSSWLRDFFGSAPRQAARFARTHGTRARDVMSTELVTVSEDETVDRIAALIEERNVRRVPVVREGRLVGLVSRADLMRAILSPPEVEAGQPDARIRREILASMRDQPWADTYFIFAEVEDGVVTFHGFSRAAEVERALRVLAERVPGVKTVRFDLVPTPPMMMGA